jgi:hypothetical protein
MAKPEIWEDEQAKKFGIVRSAKRRQVEDEEEFVL